jgi:arylformamidase
VSRDTVAEARVVDLTHDLVDGMVVHPLLPRPSFRDIATVEVDGYAMSEYSFVNHSGTHLDAPSHHVAGGETLDDIRADRLFTSGVVLDFTDSEPGALTRARIEPELGRLRPGDVALVNSGNGRNWGTDAYWTGWSYPDAEAASAMIARGISGIGFDGPSADPADSTSFELHKLWLGAGCLILENLANLDRLRGRVELVIAPLKVRGANGAPARVFALVRD